MLTKNMLSGKDTAFQIAAKFGKMKQTQTHQAGTQNRRATPFFLSKTEKGVQSTEYRVQSTICKNNKKQDNPYILLKTEKQTLFRICFYKNNVLYFIVKSINSYVRKKEGNARVSGENVEKVCTLYSVLCTLYSVLCTPKGCFSW